MTGNVHEFGDRPAWTMLLELASSSSSNSKSDDAKQDAAHRYRS